MASSKADIDLMIDSVHLNHPVRNRFASWLFYYSCYRGCLSVFPQLSLSDWEGRLEIIQRIKDISIDTKHNLLASHIDLIVAKLTAYNPVPEFFSFTDNYEDVRVARVLNILYQSFFANELVDKELQKFISWAVMVGTGYLKPHWSQLDDIPISLDRPPHVEGDIDIPCINPFNVFPDPFITSDNINHCQWIIHSYQIPMSMAENYFPGKEFAADVKEIEYDGVIGRYLSTGSLGSANKFRDKVTRVSEYWEKGFPGRDTGGGKGKGLLKVRIGGQTVYTGPNPNFDNDLDGSINPYPFIKFTTRVPVGSFYGDGYVDRLVESQSGINNSYGTMTKNLKRLANALILLPDSCGIEEEDFENPDKEVLKVAGADRPSQMQVQSFDQGLVSYYNLCKDMLAELSGLGAMSFGQVPQGGSQMSAVAARTLTDAEAVKAGIVIKDYGMCISDLGLKFSHLAKRIPKNALLKYLSWSNAIDADYLKEADLKGNFKISTQVKSGFGIGPQQRFEQTLMLYDRKLIPPDVIDKEIDYQYVMPSYASYMRRAYEKANRDLRSILAGNNPPDISPYDPHELMIQQAKDFMMGDLYYNLDKEHKDLIHQWMGLHEQYMQQQLQQQQAMLGNKNAGVPPQGRDMKTQDQIGESLSQSPGAPPSNGGM